MTGVDEQQIAGPSRTAILVAAARAFGSREPDASVRNPDLLADRLIGPAELAMLGDHAFGSMNECEYSEAVQKPALVMLSMYMLLRTRFIDEALERAVRNGTTQVVILGAGFDSRAYRFGDLLKDCRVVEVDARATQEYKRQRLGALSVDIPKNLQYVELDFGRDDLAAALRGAGMSASEKTFYIWEGVCMYLPEARVRSTLSTLAKNSAPGSMLVLDFVYQAFIDTMRTQPPGALTLPAAWQEPWLFGVPGADAQDFFGQVGFDVASSFAAHDPRLAGRYAMRPDGTVYGSEVFRKMRAEAMAKAAASGQTETMLADRPAIWLAELAVRGGS